MRLFLLVSALVSCPLLHAATFRPAGSYPVRDLANTAAIADVNKDGKPDVISGDDSKTITIWLGDGKGALTMGAQYPVGGQVWWVRVGDVNGDGNPDIVTTYLPDRVAIFLGNGDGTFRTGQVYQVKSFVGVFALADLNRDGKLDIAIPCGATAQVAVLMGNGDGTFRAPQYFQTSAFPQSVVAADFNGDGFVDLAIGCEGVDTHLGGAVQVREVVILRGGGDGGFLPMTIVPVVNGAASLAAADLDGDGRPDIVGQAFNGTAISVIWNKGAGSFQTYEDPQIQGSAYLVTLADVDGDGKMDILTSGSGGLNVHINVGDHTFRAPVTFPASLISADAGDLNGDGKLDVVTTTQDRAITVRLNAPTQYIARASADRSVAVYGERVNLIWQMSAAESSFSAPTGTVTWVTGVVVVGTASIAASGPNVWSATLPALLPAAMHNVIGQFTGDGVANTPSPVPIRVDRAPSALTASVNTASPSLDQPVSVSAKVASVAPLTGQPTGSVQWREGSTGLVSVPMDAAGQAAAVIPALGVGAHVLQVTYSGDPNYLPSAGTSSITVQPAASSITMSCLPNPAGAGETVRCSVRAGDARATGSVTVREGDSIVKSGALAAGRVEVAITDLAPGQHTLAASYSGDNNFLPADSTAAVVNVLGALAIRPATHESNAIAPQSIASLFGTGFASDLFLPADAGLPEELGGARVTVVDSAGAPWRAGLQLVSPGRINFLVPSAAEGPARVMVSGDGSGWAGAVEIRAVAPGLFSASGDGKGVAAASVLSVAPDGSQTYTDAFKCTDDGGCGAVPIDLGDGTNQIYLLLFGTGFRNAAAQSVNIGDAPAEIVYWGAQQQQGDQPPLPGRDQITVRIAAELGGRGAVTITGSADGATFNPVGVEIK